MQLNDILEENTLAAISRKTRLSTENLEKLFALDFNGFRKVQALGFISILEREYRADLSDVREACHAYFEEHAAAKAPKPSQDAHLNPPHKPSVIMDVNMSRHTPQFLKPLIIGLIVVGLLFAAWQTYSANMQTDHAPLSRSGEHIGFFASILHRASAWMDGDRASDINGSAGSSEHEEANMSNNAFALESTPEPSQPDTSADTAEQPAQTVDDIIQQVRKEQAKKLEAQRQTPPATTDASMQKIDDALAAATEEGAPEQPLATEVPSIADTAALPTVETTSSQEAAAQRKAAEEEAMRAREARQKAAEEQAMRARAAREKAAREKAAREKAAREKAAREKAAKARIIILKPRKKTWLGIVNLITMKRRTVTSKDPQTFDTNTGRWLVATGHGFIDFSPGPGRKNLNDGKQHFLLIEKGTVKEISHKVFQKLSKSKVW